jgi:hypothetical protein
VLIFDYFKKTVRQLKSNNSNSFPNKNTIFLLGLSELFIVVVGILLALYIDRWNSSRNFVKQYENTLKIVQQNIESDIFNSDVVIAHFNARDSLLHNIMLNKFDRQYYENGVSHWQKQ